MERRQALFLTAGILGSTLIGTELFLSGCSRKKENEGLFSSSDLSLLDEVGETILPETERSPGAKAAKIGQFMATIVTDCYAENEQIIFINGLSDLDARAEYGYGARFIDLVPMQKHDFLVTLDLEAKQNTDAEQPHYFRMIKELTLWGYFTSEPGATKALRYLPIPGKFKGCIPYKTGDKAWAT